MQNESFYDSLSLMEKEVKVKTKKTEKKPKREPKSDSSKVYELSFILLPDFTPEEALKETADITTLITDNKGDIISSENPVLIDLSYEMIKVTTSSRKKYSKGYFGWVKFEVETDDLASIKTRIDQNNGIIRHLLIKTVAENTLLNGKMDLFRKDDRVATKRVSEEEVVVEEDKDKPTEKQEINPEELDKSINDLVIE